jgi:hypothetical protein
MAKKKTTAKAARRKTTLGGFFRALHRDPETMRKFSTDAKGRKAVIEQSNLAPAHKDLLKSGCVPDIIRALAGIPPGAEAGYTSVQCCDEITCGHVHCTAFSKAAAIPIGKKTTAKKTAAKKTTGRKSAAKKKP